MKLSKKNSFDIERNQLFERLIKGNASCLELALHGFLRMYEEGEPKCECTSCNPTKLNDKFKEAFKSYQKK